MKRFALVTALIAALALAATALAATKLSGTFTTTISGKGPSTLNGALDGTWKITFKKGAYKVTDNGHAAVNGAYKLKGSTISLTDKAGPAKCSETGKYKFQLNGKTLKLTKISDPCAGRAGVLSRKLTKV